MIHFKYFLMIIVALSIHVLPLYAMEEQLTPAEIFPDLQLTNEELSIIDSLLQEQSSISDDTPISEKKRVFGSDGLENNEITSQKAKKIKNQKSCNKTKQVCDICKKMVARLPAHKKVHDRNPFVCTYCSHCFATELELNKHVSNQHSSTAQFVCSKCNNKTFAQESKLALHYLTVHNIDYYSCEKCEFKSSFKTSLIQHCQLMNH